MQHKHYDLCYRAHANTSHIPEDRAKSLCRSFDENEAEIKQLGGNVEKHEALFIKWMQAKGRCISSMITGPANFPVARAVKANAAERKHGEAYFDYCDKVLKHHERKEYYRKHPEARPIKTDDTDAKERLAAKVAKLEENHEKMKKANVLLRKGDTAGLVELFGEEAAAQILEPNCFGQKGFAQFELTNNLAKIKAAKQRLRLLERAEAMPVDNEATRYTVDTEGKRVFFEFDGKPDDETRTLLKGNGFKWTPSKGHWGRVLTNNAIYKAKYVAQQLEG